ncbi:mitochondrial carrier domain-containing protein [Roridomyces roridus]|uniref:Mitochondrial carrier domain-containing protein n=1 Tax=Roridomyces roridus TaxID=1738132 RepID=A0AAD7C7R5_9AGAR|nr:mitochondrial carrier domain-containing protein [Roridomyces roridus]
MADTLKPMSPEEPAPQSTETDPLLPRSETAPPEPPRKRTPLEIALMVFFGLICAAFLAVFIKGWIDADDVDFDLEKALKKALGGGLSGAAGEISSLRTCFRAKGILAMPLRTVMNYQYRYGTSMTEAIHTLYQDGGYARYYQGLSAALVQGPVSRFGDTAANAGILALLDSNAYLKKMPSLFKTVFASLAAAAFRMILTPIDTLKTTLQTQGKAGIPILRARIKMYGVGSLWYGAVATAAATFAGHYPWFATLNYLEANLPEAHGGFQTLLRRAFIGFCASITSDTVSNSLRVVKTYRQVNETRIGYFAAARAVIATDGVIGLFGRGLKTRILANGLQGVMFTVLWKYFEDLFAGKKN